MDPPASVSSSQEGEQAKVDQALASSAVGDLSNMNAPTNMVSPDGWLSPAAQGDGGQSMIPGADLPRESDDGIDGQNVGISCSQLDVDWWMNPLQSSVLTHPLDPESMLATGRMEDMSEV